MHQPHKPIESPILIVLGLVLIMGGCYYLYPLSFGYDQIESTMIGAITSSYLALLVGILLFVSGIWNWIKYRKKLKLIDELSRSGVSIETVIVMRRAIAGRKRQKPRGYEYLSKSQASEKIYGSDMVLEDLYHPGQRVTVWHDIAYPDRYWVDLESVRDETPESRAFLESYLDKRGRGIFDILSHMYDDNPSGQRAMKILLYMLLPVQYILEKTGILQKIEEMNTLQKTEMIHNSENEKGSN